MSDGYEDIEGLMGEYYLIETDEDGSRYIHIEEYIWDAKEAGRTCEDEDGNEVDADVVVTEFAGCYIPMKELLVAEDRFDLVMDSEAESNQYEEEYTFEQFRKLYPPSELSSLIDAGTCYSAEYLHWDDITEDTPDGWYRS